MSVLKIKLDEEGEGAIGAAGLSLTDLMEVITLGEKQETLRGTEIRFELKRVAARIGPRAAAGMHRLDGMIILVVGGRIRGCRHAASKALSGEDGIHLSDEGRKEASSRPSVGPVVSSHAKARSRQGFSGSRKPRLPPSFPLLIVSLSQIPGSRLRGSRVDYTSRPMIST